MSSFLSDSFSKVFKYKNTIIPAFWLPVNSPGPQPTGTLTESEPLKHPGAVISSSSSDKGTGG